MSSVKKVQKQGMLNFEQVTKPEKNRNCRKTKGSAFNGTLQRLVCDHHQRALLDAGYCLKASVANAALGAGLICYSVLTNSSDYSLGLIAHSLSVVFYGLSVAANKRAKSYYESLHDYQAAMLAASIADDIQDPVVRDWVRANIALNLIPSSKHPGKTPRVIRGRTTS